MDQEVMKKCELCPRECKADRFSGQQGVCHATDRMRIARAALHMWEEPCISGKTGSGTVFFTGCPLRCVFCQNYKIAMGNTGKVVEKEELAEIFLKLQEEGANNINLVTPDHYVPVLIPAVTRAKAQGLNIPIVYNTGSYVHTDTIRALEGIVDVYLPDFKYYSDALAIRYANAKDYRDTAQKAIKEMVRQTGVPVFFEKETGKEFGAEAYNDYDGTSEVLIKKGTIVRHLLLPGQSKDSMSVIGYLLKTYGNRIYISIMNQYTPVIRNKKYPELSRKVTEEEYGSVIDFAISAGIENGFIQEGDTASESFIPDFEMY